MVWSHLDRSGNFLNTALLKTRLLKSLYSLGMSSPVSSMLFLLLQMFNSSFLYASSSRLTNNTFSLSFIISSSTSLSSTFSGSFGI